MGEGEVWAPARYRWGQITRPWGARFSGGGRAFALTWAAQEPWSRRLGLSMSPSAEMGCTPLPVLPLPEERRGGCDGELAPRAPCLASRSPRAAGMLVLGGGGTGTGVSNACPQPSPLGRSCCWAATVRKLRSSLFNGQSALLLTTEEQDSVCLQ